MMATRFSGHGPANTLRARWSTHWIPGISTSRGRSCPPHNPATLAIAAPGVVFFNDRSGTPSQEQHTAGKLHCAFSTVHRQADDKTHLDLQTAFTGIARACLGF